CWRAGAPARRACGHARIRHCISPAWAAATVPTQHCRSVERYTGSGACSRMSRAGVTGHIAARCFCVSGGDLPVGITLYPAIELLGGKCLALGESGAIQEHAYTGDPLEAARRWRDLGAVWLHVVDLDGTLKSAPQHLNLVRSLASETGLQLQLS